MRAKRKEIRCACGAPALSAPWRSGVRLVYLWQGCAYRREYPTASAKSKAPPEPLESEQQMQSTTLF